MNHHKVKLLRGFGLSITIKDHKIILENGRHFYESVSDVESYFPSQFPYERIIISGKGNLSTEAIKTLGSKNVSILLTDTYGNILGSINPPMSSLVASRHRMTQYDTFRDGIKVDYLQKQILYAKIFSEIKFLESLPEESSKVISSLQKTILQIPHTVPQKMTTLEASASRQYFKHYGTLFDAKYSFDSRNINSKTKQNSTDVINALLNYGYAVLAGEISKHINGIGMDVYYGFYHKNHESFQSLVYDMIEPFRWIVEKTVYRLANAKNKKLQIKKTHYTRHNKSGMVLLDTQLIKKFLEMLEVDFRKTREYSRKNGMKKSNGLSNCSEITISKIVIQNLCDFCMGKMTTFVI